MKVFFSFWGDILDTILFFKDFFDKTTKTNQSNNESGVEF
jgi:hypothetical protein